MRRNKRAALFAAELRKWWSFDDGQVHTHSWHTREDFIEKELPALLAAYESGRLQDRVTEQIKEGS